jgi:hypothetical protein
VAVLRLHAASTGHVTDAAYSCLRGVYVRYGTKCARTPKSGRTSENPQNAKFAFTEFSEVRPRRSEHKQHLRWLVVAEARIRALPRLLATHQGLKARDLLTGA